jgi:hypothetical protein
MMNAFFGVGGSDTETNTLSGGADFLKNNLTSSFWTALHGKNRLYSNGGTTIYGYEDPVKMTSMNDMNMSGVFHRERDAMDLILEGLDESSLGSRS